MIKRLSIRQRLSVFTCALLLFVIATYSLTSYIGVRKAALAVGSERLRSLTKQLGSMLQQSTQGLFAATYSVARQDSIRNYLFTKDKKSDSAIVKQLMKFNKDTATVFVDLLGQDRQTILSAGKESVDINIHSDAAWKVFNTRHDTAAFGKLYSMKGAIYYPIIVSISNQHKIVGYLVRWRKVFTSPKAASQLTELLGLGATLYFGNNDGTLWTDLVHSIARPTTDSLQNGKVLEYNNPTGVRVLAAVQQLTNTQWTVLVEFSKEKMTEAANRFLYWDIMIGVILIVIGIVATWLMSRSITKPLQQLTTATSAIAGGNYSWLVEISREDEVGILARSFNDMVIQVQIVKQDLERKVKERTTELVSANAELEAFSYSVSHDLRAPLRAISGYASMLKEDYEPHLDAEAKRIIDTVIVNTKMMGQLIDDLISFSIMGKKKIGHQLVDMKMLAETCLSEVLVNYQTISVQVSVAGLPACYGDQNMLKQVWINLISNAVKYSSKQTAPNITIGFREETYSTIYYIRDNGVGFSMQYASKLFNTFQRLHSHEEFEGTGIGLALVKRIIDKHNGAVSAESQPGKETVFYFSIPKSKF